MTGKNDREKILDILFQSEERLTAQAYIKKIKMLLCISFFEAKKIVQKLIDDQTLCYNYIFGSTYVEKSFLKPIAITNNFILKPPGCPDQLDHSSLDPGQLDSSKLKYGQLNSNTIEIILSQGISFGSGNHPTTNLCPLIHHQKK
jgi:ribosomal protein L11 methyltransferase